MIPLSIQVDATIQQFRSGTCKKGMHLSDMPSENPCQQSETVRIQTLYHIHLMESAQLLQLGVLCPG